jgi:hypothetical protein
MPFTGFHVLETRSHNEPAPSPAKPLLRLHISAGARSRAKVRARYKSRSPDKRMVQGSGFDAIEQTHEYLISTVAKLQHFFSCYFNLL